MDYSTSPAIVRRLRVREKLYVRQVDCRNVQILLIVEQSGAHVRPSGMRAATGGPKVKENTLKHKVAGQPAATVDLPRRQDIARDPALRPALSRRSRPPTQAQS